MLSKTSIIPSTEAFTFKAKRTVLWKIAAVVAWSIPAIVILCRSVSSGRHSVLATYAEAGQRWLDSEPLYKGGRGFVYSPPVAALFTSLALLSSPLRNALSLAINMGGFVAAISWWLNARLSPDIDKEKHALVFLFLLPLSIGNFYIGQVNPLLTGLLVAAIVAVNRRSMTLAALCVALSVYFKLYPVALGLVLAAVYFKEFAWRFLLALIGIGAASFFLQRPDYVWSQYQLWFESRVADNRRLYALPIAPRDLYMVLRALHIPICDRVYVIIQVASGGAIALFGWLGRYRFRWLETRLLMAIFCLVCVWMMLCGPATESATYIMVAPAVILALLQSFAQGVPGWMRIMIVSSLGVFLMGLAINSFLRLQKNVYIMSVQPMAALIFGCFVVAWTLRDSAWTGGDRAARDQRRPGI